MNRYFLQQINGLTDMNQGKYQQKCQQFLPWPGSVASSSPPSLEKSRRYRQHAHDEAADRQGYANSLSGLKDFEVGERVVPLPLGGAAMPLVSVGPDAEFGRSAANSRLGWKAVVRGSSLIEPKLASNVVASATIRSS